jgi:hypothetical protein
MREQLRKAKDKLQNKAPGDQASAKKPASAADEDDPFADMISDDDGPPVTKL